MPRRPLDSYMTPPHYVQALVETVGIKGRVYEPCVGDGAIADILRDRSGIPHVVTNDLNPDCDAHYHCDARRQEAWSPRITFGVKWVVTNPPFAGAFEILRHALHLPHVALLARLSFLEPTRGRAELLAKRPPRRLIVLPRYSFRRNDQGRRQTDSVTCAWLVWSTQVEPGITIWPHRDV